MIFIRCYYKISFLRLTNGHDGNTLLKEELYADCISMECYDTHKSGQYCFFCCSILFDLTFITATLASPTMRGRQLGHFLRNEGKTDNRITMQFEQMKVT